MRTALVSVGAVFLLLCSAAVPEARVQSVIIQRVIVKVNGEIFTQKDLEKQQIDILRDQGKNSPSAKDLEQITPDILVSAVDELIIVQRGRELGYHLSDEEFKRAIDNLKRDQKLDDAGFKAALGQEGLTLDSLREHFDRSYVMQMVEQREIMGHMNLTEEEAHQYYDKHPDEFMKPATVMLREILAAVPTDPKNAAQPFNQTVDNAAKEKVMALRERALQNEDFEKLVTEASDAPSKANGGLIGPINVGEMSSGIRDAIDKLKVGDVTPPIRAARGYQLFKLESRTAAERQPFDAVRDEIANKIGQTRLDVEKKKYLQQLRTQALIEWKRDDMRQMYEKRLAETQK